ncbi:MAG: hypothetical protein KDE27_03535 [Planctomycetes bacterium]|nr:hypothetical protein [Planctomycetota bacterium]
MFAGACVTVYEDVPLVEDQLDRPEFAIPVTIPLGRSPASASERALVELYDGVLRQLQEAVDDREVAVLFGLLDAYEKPGLPDWLGERLAGYRALGHGLAFLEHATGHAALGLAAGAGEPAPTIGEPLRFELAVPAPGAPVQLGGRGGDDPTGFAVAFVVEDVFAGGDRNTWQRSDVIWLPSAVELTGDAVLRQPIELAIPDLGAARRTVHVRVDLFGYVRASAKADFDTRAPLRRRTIAATSVTLWPAGYEPIAARPLATLREALRRGDPEHFRHVFLGAVFTKGAEREQALALLIDQVRFGPEPLARVAMATLQELTGRSTTVGDREAWLAWWGTGR